MPTNLRQHDLTPSWVPIERLQPLGRATRRHPAHQVKKLATNLETYGFVAPIIVDEANRIVAGAALVEAAKRLLLTEVPAVQLQGLTEAQLRSLRLALNRLADDASWNLGELKLEFEDILELDLSIDLTLTGFEMGEIDLRLQADEETDDEPTAEPPDRSRPAITQLGDLWILGEHRLICSDALQQAAYTVLLGEERARAVHSDLPYNLEIEGNVSGKGRVVHGEFAMATGEMDEAEFTKFLAAVMRLMAEHSVDGALHYLFMDWRHLPELYAAARQVYTEQKNLICWAKTNAGMGSLYRSRHELIAIFKVGTAQHVNNVHLGKYGRNRSNVWTYPGANTFRAGRLDDLAAHPTVKPLRMIADAILDSTNRGDVVLDPFVGSGTTLLACEETGRLGRGIELDAYYVDTTIRRWQQMTGENAILANGGETFSEIEQHRRENDQQPSQEHDHDGSA